MKRAQAPSQPTTEQKILLKQWEKYRGNIVMVVGEKIYSTRRANKVNKMVEAIEKKFHKRPLITYIPKEGTLILFL